MSSPVTVPARRPEDDALDRLDDYLGRAERLAYEHKAEWVGLFQGGTSDLATVREALERQRGRIYILENMRSENYIEALEAAEAEVRQLREERDALLNWKRSMSASPSDGDGA
jgi:hypothetical protein